MYIFLALNGIGVIFLLYALVNFWIEGRPGQNDRQREKGISVVIAPSASRKTGGGFSVLPFPSRSIKVAGRRVVVAGAPDASEAPVRRVSAR
jgi:hypothetical protein